MSTHQVSAEAHRSRRVDHHRSRGIGGQRSRGVDGHRSRGVGHHLSRPVCGDRSHAAVSGRDGGFTLVEALFALVISTVALMALAQVFVKGMTVLGSSQPDLIAREKAAEAIESVYAARDSQTITWAQLRNLGNGGIFKSTAEQLHDPGADGLVNTADDAVAVQRLTTPGADGQLGTADDEFTVLDNFRRQIVITDVEANLRQIQVTVTWQVGDRPRTFVLTTLISQFS
ncbi:MAG: prepilin-type N-terminal cleavage/methylation domain-containing protein [Vicinamibacterales bacterium]